MTAREQILVLIQNLNQDVTLISNHRDIYLENPMYGEPICFEFDNEGNLIQIYS